MTGTMNRNFDDNDRIPWLDVFKGIGIILIVTGHIYHGNSVFSDWIYSFHVPVFFFASGFLYREKDIRSDFLHRIQTIVIPYFSFGLLILIYWSLIEHRFRSVSTTPAMALLGLISGEYHFLAPFNSHLWFLPCFFVTAVLYNIFHKTFGKAGTILTAVIMSLVYTAQFVLGFSIPELPWGLERACRYIAFFLLGNIFHEQGFIKRITGRNPIFHAFSALFLLSAGFIFTKLVPESDVFWFVTGTFGILGVLYTSVLICSLCMPRFSAYCGRISLVIYCLHGPVYRIIIKLLSLALHTGTEPVRNNVFAVSITVILTLIICSFAYIFTDRFAPFMIGKNLPGKKI